MPAVYSEDQSGGWQTYGAIVVVDGDDAAVPLSTSQSSWFITPGRS